MYRLYQSFIDDLAGRPDIATVEHVLTAVATAFELPAVAYLAEPRAAPADTALISNYPPGWIARYLEFRYDRCDPVVARAAAFPEPFCWGGGAPWPSGAQPGRFLEEAASFGIRSGLTIPIPDPAFRFAALTFAAEQTTRALRHAARRQGSLLQLMAIYLHRQARHIARAPAGKDYSAVTDSIRLTSRERECIAWAARGKSACDIGQILGISRRTAAFHLDNIRAKLGVHSLAQAIALLAAGGQLG